MKFIWPLLFVCLFYQTHAFAQGVLVRTAKVKMSIVYDPYGNESSTWDFSNCPTDFDMPLHSYSSPDTYVTGWVHDYCEGTLNGMPVKFSYSVDLATFPPDANVPFNFKRVYSGMVIQVNNTPLPWDGVGFNPRSSSLVQVSTQVDRIDFPHQIFVNRWPHEQTGRAAYQFKIHFTVTDIDSENSVK